MWNSQVNADVVVDYGDQYQCWHIATINCSAIKLLYVRMTYVMEPVAYWTEAITVPKYI